MLVGPEGSPVQQSALEHCLRTLRQTSYIFPLPSWPWPCTATPFDDTVVDWCTLHPTHPPFPGPRLPALDPSLAPPDTDRNWTMRLSWTSRPGKVMSDQCQPNRPPSCHRPNVCRALSHQPQRSRNHTMTPVNKPIPPPSPPEHTSLVSLTTPPGTWPLLSRMHPNERNPGS